MAKRVILAVAGAGKTYTLCHEIDPRKKNLILAYTHENIRNICKELIENFGQVPALTNVMTFDSFVYRYIVCPYEPMILNIFDCQEYKTKGITIAPPPKKSIEKDGYWMANPLCPTKDKLAHYVKDGFYYNENITELLMYAQKKAKVLSKAATAVNMLYSQVMIDEFQDFREFDYELIITLAKKIDNITLVGDYYQHSVSAVNNTGKPFKVKKKNISYDAFIAMLVKEHISVDNTSLAASRRCPQKICDFITAKLGISIVANNDHYGEVIWLTPDAIPGILEDNKIPKLVFEKARQYSFNAINWSYSKGDTLECACVILTERFDNMDKEEFDAKGIPLITINKLYVALTRTKGDLYLIKYEDFNVFKERYLVG